MVGRRATRPGDERGLGELGLAAGSWTFGQGDLHTAFDEALAGAFDGRCADVQCGRNRVIGGVRIRLEQNKGTVSLRAATEPFLVSARSDSRSGSVNVTRYFLAMTASSFFGSILMREVVIKFPVVNH